MRDPRRVRHVAAVVLSASLVIGGMAAGAHSIALPVSAQEIQTGAPGTVNVDSLTVRDTPSLSGAVNIWLPYGTDVVVVGGPVLADGYEWFQLEQGGDIIGWSVQGFAQSAPVSNPSASSGTSTSPENTEMPAAETTWTVTASFLDIRANPSDAGRIARIVTHGTELTQTGDSVELGGVTWFPVDDDGWIDGQNAGLALERYPLYVSADVLNVRSDPSLSGTIVQTLNRGDTVNTFGSTRDADGIAWSAVNEAGTLWVAAEYLTIRL